MKPLLIILLLCALLPACGQKPTIVNPALDTLSKSDVEIAAEKAAEEEKRLERARLVEVYRQLKKWDNEYLRTRQALPRNQHFVALNTTGCPKDFRLAWFDYNTALIAQQRHAGQVLVDGVAALATDGATAVFLGGEALKSADASMKDDPDLAIRAVQRCWIEYDIGPKDLQ
jgi:hypothetical protein